MRGRLPASLERRTLLVMAVVVVIAVGVSALALVGLVRAQSQGETRQALRNQADLVVAVLEAGKPADIAPALRVVRRESTPAAWLARDGRLLGDPAAQSAFRALTPEQQQDPGPYAVDVGGRQVLVETRALSGERVLILSRPVSQGVTQRSLPRLMFALLAGLAVAVLAAAYFSRRLAAPLSRTAAAAHDLAAGSRTVRVDPSGPREVAEVGESLNVLAEALQHSEGRQREFLLSVSHELRTPLTAIRGFGEALADGVTTGDRVPAVGATVVAEAQRMERLVNDLLDLGRIDADGFRYELVPVDLGRLVADAVPVWSSRAAAAELSFVPELPTGPVPVVVDPARVRQVLDNLCENALRVTPPGSPLVVAVRLEPGDRAGDPATALLEVRDGGPGLAEEDLPVAFERSVLHDRYRGVRRVGTGLGLALVRALTEGMGGTVEAGHAAEGGARFTARWPAGS